MKIAKLLAKRITSVALAMMIVLSFALVSVSALPADLTATGTYNKTTSFSDDGWNSWLTPLTSGMSCTAVASDDLVTAGKDGGRGTSLKITSTNDTGARIKISGVTQGKIYYMSYWYYSADSTLSVAGGTGADSFRFTATGVKNTWIKAWTTFTAPSESFIHLYGLKTNMVAYIDDVEVVEIESATGLSNTVPADAEKDVQTTRTFETQNVSGISLFDTANSTFSTSVENPHWGVVGIKFKSGRDTASDGFYFNPSQITLSANKTYYLSYYVYSPDTAFEHVVKDGNNNVVVSSRTIPQGEWTKVSSLFTVETVPSNTALKFYVDDSNKNVVYFDDFLYAQLTKVPAAAALTARNVEYDFAENTAVFSIASTQELASAATANITADGITVTGVSLSADKKAINVSVSGAELDESYALTATGLKDIYGRAIADAEVTFATPTAGEAPMTIASASIVDGASDVIAPVDSIYFNVAYPLDPATVIPANFAIEGYKASITAVSLVEGKDNKEVKVTLDGIWPGESYTLSVENVANTTGGKLTDSITFTTKTTGRSYKVDFENGIPAEYVGLSTHSTESGGMELVKDFGHESSQSIMLKGMKDKNNYEYTKVEFRNMSASKTYLVSFWYYSDTWTSGNTGGTGYGTPTDWNIQKGASKWNKITVHFTPAESNGAMHMSFYGVGEGATVYIDDLEVREVNEKICNPVITKGGEYVSEIAEGTTVISIPVKVDASTVKAFAVQYGEDNRMLRAAQGVADGNVLNITLENGEKVKTKIIVMDSTSYAPLADFIQYN